MSGLSDGLSSCNRVRKKSPLFVDQWVKLNQQQYRDDILVGALLPWARELFKKRSWSFQPDSAPSHGAKKTQAWLSENVPHFITKNSHFIAITPDFEIWSYFESKVSTVHNQSLEDLKVKLRKDWVIMPPESHS